MRALISTSASPCRKLLKGQGKTPYYIYYRGDDDGISPANRLPL